jgi:hypothetical protein
MCLAISTSETLRCSRAKARTRSPFRQGHRSRPDSHLGRLQVLYSPSVSSACAPLSPDRRARTGLLRAGIQAPTCSTESAPALANGRNNSQATSRTPLEYGEIKKALACREGGVIPTLNDNRSVSAPNGWATRSPWQRRGFDPLSNMKPYKCQRAPMRKPRFRMDRACECALSGRILFWGRFSHRVAIG